MRLSEGQISQLKGRLRHRFDVLREEVRRELVQSDHERYADLAGDVPDPGDQSMADLLADPARRDRRSRRRCGGWRLGACSVAPQGTGCPCSSYRRPSRWVSPKRSQADSSP